MLQLSHVCCHSVKPQMPQASTKHTCLHLASAKVDMPQVLSHSTTKTVGWFTKYTVLQRLFVNTCRQTSNITKRMSGCPVTLTSQGIQAAESLLDLQEDRSCILLVALLFIRGALRTSLLELAPAAPCLEETWVPFVLVIHHQLALAVVGHLAAAKALFHVCWGSPHLGSHTTLQTQPTKQPTWLRPLEDHKRTC